MGNKSTKTQDMCPPTRKPRQPEKTHKKHEVTIGPKMMIQVHVDTKIEKLNMNIGKVYIVGKLTVYPTWESLTLYNLN